MEGDEAALGGTLTTDLTVEVLSMGDDHAGLGLEPPSALQGVLLLSSLLSIVQGYCAWWAVLPDVAP